MTLIKFGKKVIENKKKKIFFCHPNKKKFNSFSFFLIIAVRKTDHINFYDNYQRLATVYSTKHLENITPEHYQDPVIIDKKSGFIHKKKLLDNQRNTHSDSTLRSMSATNKTNITDLDKNSKPNYHQKTLTEQTNLKEKQLLQSGTEHWTTTYQTSLLVDPEANCKASRPEWSKHKEPYVTNW